MKLVRFGPVGSEKPGVLIDGIRYSVEGQVRDFDEHFFRHKEAEALFE
jgi:tetrahydromethanopterin S-methyltransferase subunit H